jgi:hypothetical protein
MLLSTTDLAEAWNACGTRGGGGTAFDLGAAVYLYATDKGMPGSRLKTPVIPLKQTPVKRRLPVARIKYNGAWDIEPYGWTRLRHYLLNETGTSLLVTSGVPLDDRGLSQYRVAYITGTDAFELSSEEIKGLRRFLLGGGTLLADAAGGSRAFTKSLEDHVRQVLREEPRAVPDDTFLLTGAGIPDAVSLAGTSYRRSAHRYAAGRRYPMLRAFSSGRRYAVVYTPLDLSVGLLGTQVYGVVGYDPDSVLPIMRNLLLYGGLSSADKAALQRPD